MEEQGWNYSMLLFFFKVKTILEGCLDLIPPPSPSVKIQNMSEKIRQNGMRHSQYFSCHEDKTTQGTYFTPHFFSVCSST